MAFSLTLPILDIFLEAPGARVGWFLDFRHRPDLGAGKWDVEIGVGRRVLHLSH